MNVEQVPSGKELANEVAHVTPFLSHFSNFCETLEIPSTIFFQSDVLFHHLEEVRELQKAGHEIGIKISEHEWQQVNKRKACVRQLREKLTEAGLKSVHMLRAPVDLSEEELRMIHEYAFENLPVSEDPMPHIGLKYGVLPLGKVVSMNLENWSDLNDDELLATVNRLRNEQKKNAVPSFVIFEASSWEFQALPGLSYTGGENFTALSKKLNFLSKQTKMEFQTLSQFCKSCIKNAR